MPTKKQIKQFDAEGSGYDYEGAKRAGLGPDKTGHWPSRDPRTGMLLKGRKHKTFHKTLKGERKAGYYVYKKGDRYYSAKNPVGRPYTEGSKYSRRK